MESAIISLETSEYLIPGVPMDIPSDMVIVLKITPFAPDRETPFEASLARSFRCILQGVIILHVEAIPTCGILKSFVLKPTALNIALLGACSIPSTILLECFLKSLSLIIFPGI